VPLEVVIEFKRDVYQMALTELARFLPPRPSGHVNRFLRGGMRARRDGCEGSEDGFEEHSHHAHETRGTDAAEPPCDVQDLLVAKLSGSV